MPPRLIGFNERPIQTLRILLDKFSETSCQRTLASNDSFVVQINQPSSRWMDDRTNGLLKPKSVYRWEITDAADKMEVGIPNDVVSPVYDETRLPALVELSNVWYVSQGGLVIQCLVVSNERIAPTPKPVVRPIFDIRASAFSLNRRVDNPFISSSTNRFPNFSHSSYSQLRKEVYLSKVSYLHCIVVYVADHMTITSHVPVNRPDRKDVVMLCVVIIDESGVPIRLNMPVNRDRIESFKDQVLREKRDIILKDISITSSCRQKFAVYSVTLAPNSSIEFDWNENELLIHHIEYDRWPINPVFSKSFRFTPFQQNDHLNVIGIPLSVCETNTGNRKGFRMNVATDVGDDDRFCLTGRLDGQYSTVDSLNGIIGKTVVVLNILTSETKANRAGIVATYFNTRQDETAIIPIDEESPWYRCEKVRGFIGGLPDKLQAFLDLMEKDSNNVHTVSSSLDITRFINDAVSVSSGTLDQKIRFRLRGKDVTILPVEPVSNGRGESLYYPGCPPCRNKALNKEGVCPSCCRRVEKPSLNWKFTLVIEDGEGATIGATVLCNEDIIKFISNNKQSSVDGFREACVYDDDVLLATLNQFIQDRITECIETNQIIEFGITVSVSSNGISGGYEASYLLTGMKFTDADPPEFQ
jgi:hypothetical protein